MGRAVIGAIEAAPTRFEYAGGFGRGDDAAAFVGACDVVVDFSTPEALTIVAEACAVAGRPLVSGTTGLDERALAALTRVAESAAVVYAPNMSIGVNILAQLIEKAMYLIPPEWPVSIDEVHRAGKRDAPSGTALRLGSIVEDARGRDAVAYRSERIGEVVGDHTVTFAGHGERLSLTHHAEDRVIFATGALVAAAWAVSRRPGLYGMNDVLSVK